MKPNHRRVLIIAGPNGAGKTTFAREFLPQEAGCPIFINADLIAAGLSPFAPEVEAVRAGRLMLAEMRRHFLAGKSFAFETTLAGRGYVRLIREWQAAGYMVKIIFLKLADAEQAIVRVAERVRQGGHHVADDVVRRRFTAGLANFDKLYVPLADSWALYDNGGNSPVLVTGSDIND